MNPDRILVVNVTRIGDTMFTTPLLRALAAHWPNAHITVLAHSTRGEVLAELPFVHVLGGIDKQSARFRGWLPGKSYDLAIVVGYDQPLVEYALRVAHGVVAFRQADESINARLYRVVEDAAPHSEHAVDRLLRLSGALGIPPAGRRLAFQLKEEEAAWAKARLATEGLKDATPLIGLQVASFPTKAYRDWPIEHFEMLCQQVLAIWPSAGFLIFGGPEEHSRTAWLHERLGDRAALLAGRRALKLRPTAAMMSLVDAYVGVDTGPTHLMSTFDIPIIGLYHCLLPHAVYGPLDHPFDFGIDHPACGGDCDETTPMADIGVEQVLARLEQGLQAARPKN